MSKVCITVLIAAACFMAFLAARAACAEEAREVPRKIDVRSGKVIFNSGVYQSGIRSGTNLGTLAKSVSPVNSEALTFGFAAQSDEAKFFIIGTLYSETLAYLRGNRRDQVLMRLKSMRKEFINLNVPNSLYSFVSRIIDMLKGEKHSPHIVFDFFTLFQPFFEEYAESLDMDKLILFRAGSWLMDYGLSAAADDRELLRQPAKLTYFITEMKRMDAPRGVLNALDEINTIAEKDDITDRDVKRTLKLIKKIQTILG